MTNSTKSTPNVDASTAPGLTAYLTPSGAEKAAEIFRNHEGYGQYLSSLAKVEGTGSLHTMRLRAGIYHIGFGNCSFNGRATYRGQRFVRSSHGFYLGTAYVVRIEGDHGEIWQNWHYTADGERL